MNILFDARYISKTSSGIGYYTINLLTALSKLNINHSLQYIIHATRQKEMVNLESPQCRPFLSNIYFESHPWFEIQANTYLPYTMVKKKIDIFHGPAMFIPFIKHKRYALISTIHDLVAFLHPETVPKQYRIYLQCMSKMVIKKSDAIIAASHSTKNDLIERFKVPEEKITVTHYAPADIFLMPPLDSASIQSVKKKFKIQKRFLLFVGTIEPRKNLKRLIRALTILNGRGLKDIQLVIVGIKGWLYDDIFREAERIKNDITFTGYVTSMELKALYQAAEIFVFPSLYEGFGLPLLEAMACGTPIAASLSSSIPEIVGDAALLFNPYDTEKIVDILSSLLNNSLLRKELQKKASERIKLFSWHKTATETVAVYEKALKRR